MEQVSLAAKPHICSFSPPHQLGYHTFEEKQVVKQREGEFLAKSTEGDRKCADREVEVSDR